MKWNEYAKVGEAFVKAFRRTAFERVTSCDFIFDVLDRLKLEEGYRAVAMRMDRYYMMFAVRSEDMKKFRRLKADEVDESDECEFRSHVDVESSAMGVWQSMLLDLAVCLMPLAGESRYMTRKFIFSTASLKAVKNRGNFDCNMFVGDKRLLPTVVMYGDSAVVRYCYWNDWEGLVLCTDYVEFDWDGRLVETDEKVEVLFEYDCGVSYSDVDLSSLWVRRREVGNGVVEELKEIEAEAMEWIEDYDDFLRECETDDAEFGGGEYGDDDEDYDEEYDEYDGPESEHEADSSARERYEAAMRQIADKLKEAVRQKEKKEKEERSQKAKISSLRTVQTKFSILIVF